MKCEEREFDIDRERKLSCSKKLPANDIQRVITDYWKKPIDPPVAFVIHSVELIGSAGPSAISMECIIEVSVLSSKPMIVVPLLKTAVALEHVSITHINQEDQSGNPSQSVELKDIKLQPGYAYVGVINDSHCLLAPKGHYNIKLNTFVSYISNLKQAFTMDTPNSIRTNLTFKIPGKSLDVVVVPSLKVTTSVDENTTIHCSLPSTGNLSIKWTKVKPIADVGPVVIALPEPSSSTKKEPAPKAKEMVIVSNQDILHAIGGGVVVTEATILYTISNGSVSMFELVVEGTHGSISTRSAGKQGDKLLGTMLSKRARIISVEGNGVRKWDVRDENNDNRTQIIRIDMDHEVEGQCRLVLNMELEMVSTTCRLLLPNLTPLNINRVKGSIAIQARTSIEIQELSSAGTSKSDIQELPNELRQLSNLVYAYKFLTPFYKLDMEITRHADVDVLVAVAEEVVYSITHTNGHLLYSILLTLRNTQRQFVRLKLPSPQCVIWSATVDSEAVKPSSDSEGRILLPLVKGSSTSFNANIVFVSPAEELQIEGIHDLAILFPALDIPINRFYAEVYMPSTHQYEEWKGVKEVTYWTKQPGTSSASDPYQFQAQRAPAPYARNFDRESINYNNDYDDEMEMEICEEKVCESKSKVKRKMIRNSSLIMSQCTYNMAPAPNLVLKKAKDSEQAGIKPMKLSTETMKIGDRFLFEKLLVNADDAFRIHTRYKAKPQRARRDLNRRNQASFPCCCRTES